MKKGKYHLNLLHYILIAFLLVSGVFMVFQHEVFHFEAQGDPKDAVISYLPRGEYAVYLSYEKSPEKNVVFLSGDGGMEQRFFEQEINGKKGKMELRVNIPRGMHNVHVSTTEKDGKCLKTMVVQSVGLLNKDNYFLAGLCFLGALAILSAGLFLSPEKQITCGLLTGFGILASLPLFSDAIMCANGQDLLYHMVRIEGISEGLLAGEIPVRINSVQNGGFGNLSATMYPQLFLYPVAILRLLGVSLMLSMKTLLVMINIATAFICYFSVKALCRSEKIAAVATILYVFAPYRLSNLYFRGAIGESLAMVFLPLVFFGITEVLWRDIKKWPVLALGMTGVLQSHVLSVEMCALFCVLEGVFWIFKGKKSEFFGRITYGIGAVLLTVAANAFFLVPFMYFGSQNLQAFHLPDRTGESAAHLSQLFALFTFPEGYNLGPETTQGEMPMSVGGVFLFGAAVFIIAYLSYKTESENNKTGAETLDAWFCQLGSRCLIYGAAAVFLASRLFPWEKAAQVAGLGKLTVSLQFPWRFLSPASFFFSVMTAIGICLMADKKNLKWLYGAFGACLLVTTGWFFDQVGHNMSQIHDKVWLESLDTSDSIYMISESEEFINIHDRYRREDASVKTKYATPAEFSDYKRQGSRLSVNVKPLSEEPDELMFPVYYYPGYEVKINGKAVDCYSLVTWVTCEMPDEEALVELSYRGPWYFRVADIVSIFGMLALAGCLVYPVVKKDRILMERKE